MKMFDSMAISSIHTAVSKNHGRIETRKCEVIDNLVFIDKAKHWEGIRSVIRITATREDTLRNNVTTEQRYYISSLVNEAKQFNYLIRNHWGIENKLHWILDVNYNEDKSRLRQDYGDENFAIIRKSSSQSH